MSLSTHAPQKRHIDKHTEHTLTGMGMHACICALYITHVNQRHTKGRQMHANGSRLHYTVPFTMPPLRRLSSSSLRPNSLALISFFPFQIHFFSGKQGIALYFPARDIWRKRDKKCKEYYLNSAVGRRHLARAMMNKPMQKTTTIMTPAVPKRPPTNSPASTRRNSGSKL